MLVSRGNEKQTKTNKEENTKTHSRVIKGVPLLGVPEKFPYTCFLFTEVLMWTTVPNAMKRIILSFSDSIASVWSMLRCCHHHLFSPPALSFGFRFYDLQLNVRDESGAEITSLEDF